MKQETEHTIVIGKKPSQNRIMVIGILLISCCLALLFTWMILEICSLYIEVPMILKIFLLSVLWIAWFYLLFSIFAMSMGYWAVSETQLYLIEMTKLYQQRQLLSNIIFHTDYDLLTFTLSLDVIEYMELYAVEAFRSGRLFGDPGWELKLKFWLKDGSMFMMPHVLEYKHTKLVDALDYLQGQGIPLKDEQHLLSVMRNQASIRDFLNGEESE